ncbi:MAG: hypothetical protein HC893_15370 [Chloroflexaceae bacterium]|nr:hypothetical protein [Chloroflexaceae bacterium]
MTMYPVYPPGGDGQPTHKAPLSGSGDEKRAPESKGRKKTIYCDIFQYTTSDIAPEDLLAAVRESAEEFFLEPVSRRQIVLTLHETQGMISFDHRLHHKDGSAAPARLHLQVIGATTGPAPRPCHGLVEHLVAHKRAAVPPADAGLIQQLEAHLGELTSQLAHLTAQLEQEMSLRRRAEARLQAIEERYRLLGVPFPQSGAVMQHPILSEWVLGEEAA